MNVKFLMKNVALSALLVTAIASPVSASSSDDATKDMEKLTPAAVTVSLKALVSPIELADKYAPETAAEWKSTMDKYYELLGFNPVEMKSIEIKPVVALENGDQAAMATVSALMVDSKQAEKFTKVVPMDKVDDHVKMEKIAINAVKVTDAITHKEIAEGQQALNKAVELKDEAVIKTSLAKLLDTYKVEITKLEQAAK